MDAKLQNNKLKHERELYENLSELYAIIKVTEKLEKAYVSQIIQPAEYETECQKLIALFKTLSSTLTDTVPSIERFHNTYNMDCGAAIKRLVSGVPATVEHRAPAAASGLTSAATALVECTEGFITAMNALDLEMTRVNEIVPFLSFVSGSLNKFSGLPPDFEGKTKINEWIEKLSQVGPNYKLSEPQVRQLQNDVKLSYKSFKAALPT